MAAAQISFLQLILLMGLALVAGLARGFSGFGAALIFVPLAARLVGPQQASPLLLMTDSIVALPVVLRAWPLALKRDVALMAFGGLFGVPLGAFILTNADAVLVRWLIAGVTTAMLALLASGWRYGGRPKSLFTCGVGAVSGLFSGIAQIGGPPVVAYWLGGETQPQVMRASTFLFFGIGSAITLISYGANGLLTLPLLKTSLVLLPCFASGLWAGSLLFKQAPEIFFRRVCLWLIAGSLALSLPLWG